MTRRRRGRGPALTTQAQPQWYRIDLHLHTPGSGDYQEPGISYLELLQRAEARGLAMVAFTDHNSVAGYATMQREIDQLEYLEVSERLLPDEARRLQEYRRLLDRIVVLPGFEFTATFGFHILGIFPPETSVRKLEHLLLALNIPEEKLDRGASDVGATTDVLHAYEIIADAGGLVIGAHVNSTHGIAMIGLGLGGQTKIAYTQDPHLHALEVTDLESTSRRATARFFNGSKPEYPRRMHCIQGSDAHRLARDPLRPEKNLGVGDRATEVLLAEVSFPALQTLLASTDFSRTRPAREPEQHPFDPLTSAREEGATIVQAFHDVPGAPPIRVKALLRDIAAFANTNGGILYVGASADPAEPIRGVDGAVELAELIRVGAASQITPPVNADVEPLSSDGKTVLVVTVPKGTETPYALEPGYIYVRQEGETALALRDEIVQLVRAAVTSDALPEAATPIKTEPPEPQPVWPEDVTAAEAPAPEPVAAPPARAAQQMAVQQATAAERERQQEPTPVPRTGVEIIASVERDGVIYHTVRDLRNRRVVRNVTRESARRLWRYAILQAEEHIIEPDEIRWDERDGRFGFWKGYRQSEGMRRYNLIYREPASQRQSGEQGERLRIFFGVTEDGIDDRWRGVLPPDQTLPVVQYDDDFASVTPPEVQAATEPAPEPTTITPSAAPITLPPLPEQPVIPEPVAVVDEQQPEITPVDVDVAPAPRPRHRRSPRKPAPAESAAADVVNEEHPAPAAAVESVAVPEPTAEPIPEDEPAPPRRRSSRRTAAAPAVASEQTAVPAEPATAASAAAAPKPPPRRRRSPRKPPATTAPVEEPGQ